jgi:hypothetical protein
VVGVAVVVGVVVGVAVAVVVAVGVAVVVGVVVVVVVAVAVVVVVGVAVVVGVVVVMRPGADPITAALVLGLVSIGLVTALWFLLYPCVDYWLKQRKRRGP